MANPANLKFRKEQQINLWYIKLIWTTVTTTYTSFFLLLSLCLIIIKQNPNKTVFLILCCKIHQKVSHYLPWSNKLMAQKILFHDFDLCQLRTDATPWEPNNFKQQRQLNVILTELALLCKLIMALPKRVVYYGSFNTFCCIDPS